MQRSNARGDVMRTARVGSGAGACRLEGQHSVRPSVPMLRSNAVDGPSTHSEWCSERSPWTGFLQIGTRRARGEGACSSLFLTEKCCETGL
ncbi:hypothetical protein HW555_007070 [Spodoptera exigua]|uniref:Uncharacterized protein n=1 Tax=Spodoptera exigua TaxID=7107 RepID=A0A835GHR9_SPOEX|nr:hypothetical protein HW555_007070 [Spodoptera exigua]